MIKCEKQHDEEDINKEALENGRKSAFLIDANVLIDSTKEYIVMKSLHDSSFTLIDENEVGCITVKDLIDLGYYNVSDEYHCTVLIRKNANYLVYTVYLTNNSYMALYNDFTNINSNITENSIYDYSVNKPSGWVDEYDTCDFAHPDIEENENLKFLIN